MAQNIEIFIINLARSVDRRESMKQKIARIQGFGEIYIDGEKISSLQGESIDSPKQSKPIRHTERSEVSKTHKSNKIAKSMIDKRIDELDSPLRQNDSYNLDSRGLDSSLRTSASLRMTKIGKESVILSEKREVSKTSEFSTPSESRIDKRIDELDSPLQHCDSSKLDSRGLDSSLRTSCFAQNDEFGVDCFGDKSPRNDGNNAPTLHFHFFSATDANDFKDNPAKIPPHYHPKLARFVKGKDLSFGEIACFSSHYRLWEKCVALDSPIVVLEDDIDFMQDFCQIVKIFKSPFEYVRLYYLFDRKISQIYDNFYISFARISGGQGYYLTPTAAQKFIKNARFWLFCVDDYMDMFFIHNVKNIIFLPFVIAEDSANATQSTILGRTKPKMSFWRKLTRELSRIYFYVIRKGLYFALNCVEIRAFFSAKQNHK
ncbi:glycosyltransferase family 25 protein [Helicobacter sp. 23-1044]